MTVHPPVDIQHSLDTACQQLILAGLVDSPRLDAELLLAHTLQVNRTYLYTWSDKPLTAAQTLSFSHLVQQRTLGHPIAHILGEREFWSLPLKITPDTLIPRPDTETVIETVLSLEANKPNSQAFIPPCRAWSLLDLGTGSGAIALALKSELPACSITAIDFSEAALNIAKHNASALQLEVTFIQSDWFSSLPPAQTFDCIVSNPPYIESTDPHLHQGDVRFEPISALTAGKDGLNDIKIIIQQAWSRLNPHGWLLIEHGHNQADSVASIFTQHNYKEIRLIKDLSGNPRVTIGQK